MVPGSIPGPVGLSLLLEHLEGISERGPERFKTAIKYVFQGVAIHFVRVYPGTFFCIINSGLRLSDESTAKCATREQPPELDAEDQKEEEDVVREIFVLLDSTASPDRIVRWNKIAAIPRTSRSSSRRARPRELEPPPAAGAVDVSSGSDMSWRPTPGRSTPAQLRVTGKVRRCVRWRGLPDQTCSKGSSGFSDTLGVPVRPVDGCGCCVLR